MWKWIKRLALGVICLVAALLIAGASYQFICTKLDERAYPPLGQMVDIGGYKLHLYSTGSGGPTVVLDTGLGCISSDWGLVQPHIARFTRVVSYDRAGTGWSEVGPQPRTSAQSVEELHALLHRANIPGPYILVGHSLGGNNVQLFAATYPEEVAGVVLVDSCHEEQEKRLPMNPFGEHMKFWSHPLVVKAITASGLSRLFVNTYMAAQISPNVTETMRKMHLALTATSKHFSSVLAEAKVFSESLGQLEGADKEVLRTKRCIVLTAGEKIDAAKLGLDQAWADEMSAVWQVLQSELAAKFDNAKQLIAEKSDHMIPWNQPDIIVEAVRELVHENL